MDRMYKSLERAVYTAQNIEGQGQDNIVYELFGDCVEETRAMETNSIDLIHTSIPFGNHYEYSANYNDFGHNQNTERFFEQMDFLTPELLRVLKPGRVAAIHVKDRVLFGNATGTGMPTIEPFHAQCISHYMKHGFQYFGMITVVTDVVRENNQTYRLGWTEQCKDGSKMGVGCPEYILLFRKLPTDRSTAYADDPVKKSKEDYTRAQWQIDAHGYWRSSGDRLISKEELKDFPVDSLQTVYREYSRGNVYNYEDHVKLAEDLDKDGKLPATFMVVAPGSWNQLEVWDDINRMRTLNTTQSRRRAQMHVCPLQLDIVERIINRYSNEGDTVYDPFGGLMTVPMTAVKMHRNGKGCELNPDYFRDGVVIEGGGESAVIKQSYSYSLSQCFAVFEGYFHNYDIVSQVFRQACNCAAVVIGQFSDSILRDPVYEQGIVFFFILAVYDGEILSLSVFVTFLCPVPEINKLIFTGKPDTFYILSRQIKHQRVACHFSRIIYSPRTYNCLGGRDFAACFVFTGSNRHIRYTKKENSAACKKNYGNSRCKS